MEKISEGEPVLKKSRRGIKHKIIPPEGYTPCGLSPTLWFELIFYQLFLEDLIRIKRTCKSFATNKLLRNLIKDKQEAAFGLGEIIPTLFWNKMEKTNRSLLIYRIVDENPNKFIITTWFTIKPPNKSIESTRHFGVFSNKRLLWETFLGLDFDFDLFKNATRRNHNGITMFFNTEQCRGEVFIQGADKEICAWLGKRGVVIVEKE